MPIPPLVMQTTYAELVDRCAATAFAEAFPEEGSFISKQIRGRRYWYFQTPAEKGRGQKYVGPECPELLEQIARHKEARNDERERRALVSTLVRSFGLPRPAPEIGNIVAALAKAGVFRLRAVLVGTLAYQAYAAILGIRLPAQSLQTGDVDIAQFKDISVATQDHTRPMLEVLRAVDSTFRPVPNITDGRRTTAYVASNGLRVDFLTPNKGAETDKPQRLPALQTDAQPFRFLDYLIHEPDSAVILHGAGIYASVPAPERYAVHKLIVSRRRPEGAAKRDKDLHQAEALLHVLAQKRPFELKAAWNEARNRGPKWRQLISESLSQVAPLARDITLKAVDQRRDIVRGLTLTFNNSSARHDFAREVVSFDGAALGATVRCAVSREALDDYFAAAGTENKDLVKAFLANRAMIEEMAQMKYLSWPIEEPEAVLIRTNDVPQLKRALATHRRESKA